LASAEADVALSCSHTGRAAAEGVCDLIRELGRQSEYYAHDIADSVEVEAMCGAIQKDFDGFDLGLMKSTSGSRDRIQPSCTPGG
jgi:hypothetical protein